jgi:hypothetical protein
MAKHNSPHLMVAIAMPRFAREEEPSEDNLDREPEPHDEHNPRFAREHENDSDDDGPAEWSEMGKRELNLRIVRAHHELGCLYALRDGDHEEAHKHGTLWNKACDKLEQFYEKEGHGDG